MPTALPPIPSDQWDEHVTTQTDKAVSDGFAALDSARRAQDQARQAEQIATAREQEESAQSAQAQLTAVLQPARDAQATAVGAQQAQDQLDSILAPARAAQQQASQAGGALPPATAGPPQSTGAGIRTQSLDGSVDPGSTDWRAYAVEAAQKAGIDPALFQRQIQQESGFDPTARSGAGAQGIAQIVPSAHPGVDPMNPKAALDYAANWMRQLTDRYGGDVRKALAAYNAGPGAVDKYGGVPPFEETQRYVKTIYDDAQAGGQAGALAPPPVPGQQASSVVQQRAPGRVEAVGQFEQGLPADEASAICGPVAALAFAQANGRNPDLAEARALAKQVGWTSTGGMNGVANEQALLTKMGVRSKLDANPDFGHIAQDAASGNPVIISTPVHYYYASDYDQSTGKVFVGKTGTSRRGGGSWMTPQEIATLDGGINGALFVDNPQSPTPSVGASADTGGERPPSEFEQPSAFEGDRYLGRRPDQPITMGDVGDPTIAAGLPRTPLEALDAGATAVEHQAGRFAADQQELQDLSLKNLRAQRGGPALTPEDQSRLADLSSQYGLALTGEPIARVGGEAASAAGRALGAVAKPVTAVDLSADPVLAKFRGMYAPQATAASTTSLGEKLSSIGTALTRQWTDQGVDLAQFQNRVAKAAGPLPPEMMANELARLTSEPGATNFIKRTIPDVLGADDLTTEHVRTYLTAQGNVDAAAAIGQRVESRALAAARPPTATDVGPSPVPMIRTSAPAAARAATLGQEAATRRAFSGDTTAAESQQALDRLKAGLGDAGYQEVQRLGRQVVDLNNWALDQKVKSGILTQQAADEMRALYPTYTPVKVLDYLRDGASGASNAPGRSLSVRSTGIKTLSEGGTTAAREDPIASTLRNVYETQAMTRRNDAANALVSQIEAAKQANIPGVAGIQEVENGTTATRTQQPLVLFTNGVKRTFLLPSDMAAVVKQQGASPNIFAPVMSLFKALHTGLSPAFLVRNIMIDGPEALIRTAAREGGPQHVPSIVADLARAYMTAFQGLLSGTYTGDAARFLESGGGFGYFQRSEKAVASRLAEMRAGNPLVINDLASLKRAAIQVATLRPVEALGQRLELAPRTMAFARAERRGLATPEAVRQGQTVTMDFNQGGSVAKVINGFVPFFNVGMQSAAVIPRTVRENPKGALLTFAGTLAAPTLAAEAWNRADPQRARDYANVPDYVKDEGVVIMLPGPAPVDNRGERHPQYKVISLRSYAPLIILTRELAARAVGDDTRKWSDILQSALQATSPVQGLSSLEPPVIGTGLQLASDYSQYRGGPIVSAAADDRASALSHVAAASVNAAAARLGAYPDVHPSQVEFGARDIGGGVAQIPMAASDTVSPRIRSAPSRGGTPQDVPVVGGFLNAAGVGGATGQLVERAQQANLTSTARRTLYDAGLKPDVSLVKGEIDGAPLTTTEHAAYQRLANSYVSVAILRASMRPEWRTGTVAQKQQLLTDALTEAHTRATDQTSQLIGASVLRMRATRARVQQQMAANAVRAGQTR